MYKSVITNKRLISESNLQSLTCLEFECEIVLKLP